MTGSFCVLVPYVDLKTSARGVLGILRADASPMAVEFMERKVVALREKFSGVTYPCPETGSHILLTFDGRRAEVEVRLELVQVLVLKNGALNCIMDQAYHKAYELEGVASGEHGIGVSKRRYFLRETAGENLAVMNQIKDTLDPLHILNDQKSYIGGQNHAETV